ncbi:MAG: double zinc ribbon domain-containing protein [Xanthobacteraceae bacterium]
MAATDIALETAQHHTRAATVIARLLRLAARTVADLVLPPTCLACRKPVGAAGGLCPSCWTVMGFIERPYCERLGTPFPNDSGGALLSPAAIADPPAYERARAAAPRSLLRRWRCRDGLCKSWL